jgi:hypothetical protein
MSAPPHIASSGDAVAVAGPASTIGAAELGGAGALASLVSMVAVTGGAGAVLEFPEPHPALAAQQTKIKRPNINLEIFAPSRVVTALG